MRTACLLLGLTASVVACSVEAEPGAATAPPNLEATSTAPTKKQIAQADQLAK